MSYKYWYDNSKLKTCPECCVSGMDNDSLDHKCYYCNGVGKVDIEENNNDEIREH